MMNNLKATPFKFGIHLLILIHFIVFILSLQIASFDIAEYILPSDIDVLTSHWWSFMTYQFVHTGVEELVLSMGALWFFGSILRERIGHVKVLQLYLISALLGSAVFILAHLIFPTFAGKNHLMEGAFTSVLAIMSATVASCGTKHPCCMGKLTVPLWQLYLLVLAVSFFFVYEHNIACILTYVSSLILGLTYGAERRGDLSAVDETSRRGYAEQGLNFTSVSLVRIESERNQ